MVSGKPIIKLTEEENFKSVLDQLAKPLIDAKMINEKYITSIIENLEANGPYFIIAPKIALPHSNRNDLVYENAVSIGKSEKPIKVGDQEASVFILLAAKDSTSHLEYLQRLVSIMDTTEKQELLTNSNFDIFAKIVENI